MAKGIRTVAAAVVLLGSAVAHAQSAEPAPARAGDSSPAVAPADRSTQQWVPRETYRERDAEIGWVRTRRTRTGLVAAGAINLGVAYAASALGAFLNQIYSQPKNGEMTWGLIPIVGPWIGFGSLVAQAQPTNAIFAVLLAMEGLWQAGGITMMFAGFFAGTSVWVEQPPTTTLRLLPLGPSGTPGATVGISF